VGTSDEPQHVKQLCKINILACKLELDVLQDLVVDSLYENDDWNVREILASAAHTVYVSKRRMTSAQTRLLRYKVKMGRSKSPRYGRQMRAVC
jgi:hypothetical protein